jgi:serine/threonine protein kinase
VKLLHHRTSSEAVALKVLRFSEVSSPRSEQEALIRKEVSIHRQLKHENIVQFYGARMDDHIWYIFLEYAHGGELYDRIGKYI